MLLKLSKPSSKPTVAIDYDGSANLNRNTELRLMGWGSIRKNRIRLPDILQEADLDYVTSSDCSDKYEDVDGAYITEDMMCAARKGKGACSGDSGGAPYHSGYVRFQRCAGRRRELGRRLRQSQVPGCLLENLRVPGDDFIRPPA